MTRHEAIMELSALVRGVTATMAEHDRCELLRDAAREAIDKAIAAGRDPSDAEEKSRSEQERLHAKAIRAASVAANAHSAQCESLRRIIRMTPPDDAVEEFERAVVAVRSRLGDPQPQSPWKSSVDDRSETWKLVTAGARRHGDLYAAVTLDGRGVYIFASCDHGIGSHRRDTEHAFICLSERLVGEIVRCEFGFPAARTAQECEPPKWQTSPVVTTLDTALTAIDSLIEYGNTHGPMTRFERDDRW